MSAASEKHPITVVSACMNRDGLPDFALNTVEVTSDEAANGVHYDLVEARLHDAGYNEPFVHFAESESPSFLHPAVRVQLGLPAASTDQNMPILLEKNSWPESSKSS